MAFDYMLVDGNNLMFAAQQAGRKLSAGDVETTAIFGFLGSLRKLCERFDGEAVVLWDASSTWRHAAYPEYKGNRDKNPLLVEAKKALSSQRPSLRKLLDNLGIKQCDATGYEADDLAGFLGLSLAKRGRKILLVTSDRDWLQLVGTGQDIYWYDPRKDVLVSPQTFSENTGCEDADQFIEAKALMGDSSDNLPGVGGIGEVGARLIMAEFGSVGELIKQFNGDNAVLEMHKLGRYRKKIKAFLESSEAMDIFERNKRFMDLRETMSSKEDIHYTSATGRDIEKFKAQCSLLGFTSILGGLTKWLEPFNQRGVTLTFPKRPKIVASTPSPEPVLTNPDVGSW